jgi:hypothetical protein
MALQLEALPALHGDALLLHYGTKTSPQLIIVDGGPSTVYKNALRPRLEEIKASRSPDESLPVRLIMVSHIDADHITGILDLAAELDDTQGEKLVAVQELWHNAFTDVLGDETDKFLQKAADGAKISSVDGTVPEEMRQKHPSAAMIASVGQGKKLRALATNKLGWSLNDDRPLLVAQGDKKDTIDAGGKLKLTIVGPTAARLLELQKEWRKKAKETEGKSASVVEYLDKSAPNLASLVVLASDGTKKILLTGDARGDYVLSVLDQTKQIKKGKFAVDVLKVPHHGSIRDLDKDFFETIVAKDYVISANGKYNNPDFDSLEMLLSARGNDAYNVHLTYPVADFGSGYDRKALQKLIDGSKKKKYKIIPRDPKAKSVLV